MFEFQPMVRPSKTSSANYTPWPVATDGRWSTPSNVSKVKIPTEGPLSVRPSTQSGLGYSENLERLAVVTSFTIAEWIEAARQPGNGGQSLEPRQ